MLSFWQADAAAALEQTGEAVLDAIRGVDFLVIGGGFSGLSSAIELKRRSPGASVALVEAQRIGFGASGRNAGMLVPFAAPLWLIDGALDRSTAETALAELAKRYQRLAEQLAFLDGGAVPSSLFLCAPSALASEAIVWLHRRLTARGVHSELFDAQQTLLRVGEVARASLVLPAYSIHPVRVALALKKMATALGVLVLEQCSVARIVRHGAELLALTERGVAVRAARVVCAGGAWNSQLTSVQRGAIVATWMFATSPLPSETLARLGEASCLAVSLRKGFMYRRVYADRLLLGGLDDVIASAEQAAQVPRGVLPRLLTLMRASLPWLRDVDIERVWGGPIHATANQLPCLYLDRNDSRIAIVEGMGGSGVVWSLLAGQLVAGLVDPALDTPADRDFRHALSRSRVPIAGIVGLAGRLLSRALCRALGKPFRSV